MAQTKDQIWEESEYQAVCSEGKYEAAKAILRRANEEAGSYVARELYKAAFEKMQEAATDFGGCARMNGKCYLMASEELKQLQDQNDGMVESQVPGEITGCFSPPNVKIERDE